ncbi:MAG: rhomboid family intramembrane serine protease [Sporichthyaceae bacterium]
MVIPIHDRNPVRRVPIVTYAIVLLNVVVYFWGPTWGDHGLPAGVDQICRDDAFIQQYAAIPAELTDNAQLAPERVQIDTGDRLVPCPAAQFDKSPLLSAITSMFLHGGLLHLIGNMLFLWIFGNNIEDRMGRFRFTLFYLFCGMVATYGFAFTTPDSLTPLVGASGAVAGVLGAYLWLYPKARIIALVPFLFFIPLPLPAWLVLGSWFGLQALYSQGTGIGDGSVAYIAHVIGFTVGFVIAMVAFHSREIPSPKPPGHQRR